MNPFHVIEDEEVAGLFEAEIARGGGCDYSIPPDLTVQSIFSAEEEAALQCMRRLCAYLDSSPGCVSESDS